MSQIRIGISGWTYVPWRGTFYPKGLAQNKELAFASRVLNSIEINGTFYSLQRPTSFEKWYQQTPGDFVFSIKGNRYITHLRRLREVEKPLANFLASGVLRLNEKLGPILWQFPPNFQFNPELTEAFFEMLPRTTKEAGRFGRKADSFMKSRSYLEVDRDRPLRHAMEVRHMSFADEKFIKLLRKHKVALVVADTAGKWPFMEDVTSDFVYVRLHGEEQLYVSGYTDDALDTWSKKVAAWSKGRDAPDAKRITGAAPKRKSRDVFVYFDNDVKVRAPFDAMSLASRVGGFVPANPPGTSPENVEETARTSWPDLGRTKRRSRKRRS
jgi:uncharacterized protein YecE (DUF72 family)